MKERTLLQMVKAGQENEVNAIITGLGIKLDEVSYKSLKDAYENGYEATDPNGEEFKADLSSAYVEENTLVIEYCWNVAVFDGYDDYGRPEFETDRYFAKDVYEIVHGHVTVSTEYDC